MAYLDSLFPPTTSTMPSSRPTSDGSKKRALPFKAPRPVAKTSAHTATAKSAPKAAPARKTSATAVNSKVQKRSSNGMSKAAGKATAKGKGKQIVISSDEEEDESDELDEEEEGAEEEQPRQRAGQSRSRGLPVPDEDSDDDVDMDHSDEEQRAPAAKPKSRPKKRTADPLDEIPGIPPKLLTRLLYEGFEDKDMKIGKDAMAVVGKYIETFVREALARAKAERDEDDSGGGDGFLQVEDLEKMAPQLLLDF